MPTFHLTEALSKVSTELLLLLLLLLLNIVTFFQAIKGHNLNFNWETLCFIRNNSFLDVLKHKLLWKSFNLLSPRIYIGDSSRKNEMPIFSINAENRYEPKSWSCILTDIKAVIWYLSSRTLNRDICFSRSIIIRCTSQGKWANYDTS